MLAVSEEDAVVALLIHGSEEAFDLAVGLGVAWPQEVVADPQLVARLGEEGGPLGMDGVPHGEAQGVVGEDGQDWVAVVAQGPKQEVRGRSGGGVRIDAAENFPGVVVQDGELLLWGRSAAQRSKLLDVQVEQFPRGGFLVATDHTGLFGGEVLQTMPAQSAVDTARAEAQTLGNMPGPQAFPPSQAQDVSHG